MSNVILPVTMTSVLAVMLTVLAIIMFLYYRKRKLSKSMDQVLEPMSRATSRSSLKRSSLRSSKKKSTISEKQVPVLPDSQFWVPEVYSSIIQPNQTPPRKVSRMQSTLHREIYSRTQDTSYLQAAENDLFESESTGRRRSSLQNRYLGLQKARLVSDTYRGMLNFSLQYKQDRALLVVCVVKAEELPTRKDGECVDPFVDIQLLPFYKRRNHSEVHQKTLNPVFNQTFEFEVPPYEIRSQQIQFTVLDFNQQLNHNTIGTVLYDISTLDSDALKAGKEFVLWQRIVKLERAERKLALKLTLSKEKEDVASDNNSMLILLSLTYLKEAERLTVSINRARNLPLADRKGRLDHHYIAVTLRKQAKAMKKQRTSVVKHDPNPTFNKSLIYDVGRNDIEECTLVIKVRHHSEMARDRTFAILCVGHNAQGIEAAHWTEMLENSPGNVVLDQSTDAQGHGLDGGCIALSNHFKWLATGAPDGNLILRATGALDNLVTVKAGHRRLNGITHVCFSNDSRCTLTVGGDGTLSCWQWEYSALGKSRATAAVDAARSSIASLRDVRRKQDEYLKQLPEIETNDEGG
eukprot:gene3685-4202_t